MVKLIKFFSIFFLLISTLKAEVINEIIIDGNKRLSDETIKIYGEIELGKDISESDLDKIIKNLYGTEFFEDIKVNLEKNILKIELKEYPIINQVVILGENKKTLKKQIKKILVSKEKSSFNRSKISSDIENINKLYSSIGYNFSKVDVKIKNIDESNIDLVFNIDIGEETKIASINFIGDKKVRNRRLRAVIASEEDKFWKVISRNTKFSENLINLDVRLLTNYYKSIGYRDVKINSNFAKIKKSGNVDLVYSIDSGQRYTINKITTNLDKVFDKKIFFPLNEIYSKYTGQFYSPFKIKKILEEIDEIIDDNNLQFVEHNVEENINSDNIDLKFNIFEGEKFLVERIDIVGNNITNESVIRGELLVDEGDPYTKLALEKSIAEIKARNIFSKVDYEVSNGADKNLKNIKIFLEEKPTGEISAGAGIGTSGGAFAINIQENNWLGEGKRVGFNIELDKESIEGTVLFSNPNYDFLGNSLNYSISSQKNDKPDQGYENSVFTGRINTAFEQYKDVKVSLGLLASHDDLQTDNTASNSLKKQNGQFSELTADYGFSYDQRDRVFMPTNGSIFSFNQLLPLVADSSYLDNTMFLSNYNSISDDVILSSKFYLSTINGLQDDDVRLNKRKSLSNSRLRGFARNKIGPKDNTDFIGGNNAAAINVEANLPNILPDSTNVDLKLFLDFGNVWGVDYDSTIDDSNKIRSSTGIAANWMSPLGPITFTLAQNLSKANTDETESFNFNLGTTF